MPNTLTNPILEGELDNRFLVCEQIIKAAKLIHKHDNVFVQNEKVLGFISACIGIALCKSESGLMKEPVGSKGRPDPLDPKKTIYTVDKDKPETVDVIMAFHQDVSWYFGNNALNYITGTNKKVLGDIKKQDERIASNKDKWLTKTNQAIKLWQQQVRMDNKTKLSDCVNLFSGGDYEEFVSSIKTETLNASVSFFSKSSGYINRKGFITHISNINENDKKPNQYNERDKGEIDKQYEFIKADHFPKTLADFDVKKKSTSTNYKEYCDIIVAISMTQGWGSGTYDECAAGFYKNLGGGASDSFFANIRTVSDWLKPIYANINPTSGDLNNLYSYNKEANKNLKINPPQGIWKLFNLNFWNMAPDSPNGKADYFSNIELLQLMDISYASTIGSIKTFFRKIIQDPFVHGYGDSEGLMYNYNVRLKPFIEELWKCLPYYIIDKTNVISDQLTWETESYSWYRLIPVGNYFGPTTRAVDYLNSFFFSEYAKVFGNNVLDQTCNYVTYDISKNSGQTVQQNSIFLLKYMIACHCYLPFTRRGEITINYNPEIKIGNRILNVPTKEMFYIDTVRHIQKFGDKPSEVTILGVSRGMDYEDDDYWNLINYNEKTSTKKVKVGVATDFGTQDTHVEKVLYFNDDMYNLDTAFDTTLGKRENMSQYIAGVDKEIPFNLAIEYFCEQFLEKHPVGMEYRFIHSIFANFIRGKKPIKFPKYKYSYETKDKTKSLWTSLTSESKIRYFLNSNFYKKVAAIWKKSNDKKIPHVVYSAEGMPVVVYIYVNRLINRNKGLTEKLNFEDYLENVSYSKLIPPTSGIDFYVGYVFVNYKYPYENFYVDLSVLKKCLIQANKELCGENENDWFIDVESSIELTETLYTYDNPVNSNSFDTTGRETDRVYLIGQTDTLGNNFYTSFKSIMNHKRTDESDLTSDSNANKNSLHEIKKEIINRFVSSNVFNEPSDKKRQEGIASLKGMITIVASVSFEGFGSKDSDIKQKDLYDFRITEVKKQIVALLNHWYKKGSEDKKISNVVKNDTNKKTLDYLLDYTNNKENCIFRDAYDSSLGNYVVGKDIRKLSKEEMLKFIDEADIVDDFQPINEQTISYSLSQQFKITTPTNGQIMKPNFSKIDEKGNVKDGFIGKDEKKPVISKLKINKITKKVGRYEEDVIDDYFDSYVASKPAQYMAALHHGFRSVRVFWPVEAKQWESSSDTKSGDVSEVEITTTNYDWHVNKDVFLRLLNKKHKKDGFANKITQKNSSNTQ